MTTIPLNSKPELKNRQDLRCFQVRYTRHELAACANVLVADLTRDDGTFPELPVYGISTSEGVLEELPEAPIQEGLLGQFLSNNRTLAFKMNPASNEGVAWVAPQDIRKKNEFPIQLEETKVYPTFIPGFNYTEQYQEFISASYGCLQEILSISLNRTSDMRFSSAIADIVDRYMDFINTFGPENQKLADANNIIRCFHAVCFQADNQNKIASSFMNWVNCANVNPATEMLAEIMSGSKPLNHPMFWQCVCSLVLRNLTDLATQCFQAVLPQFVDGQASLCIQQIIHLLQNYDSEREPHIFRAWKDQTLHCLQNALHIGDLELRQNITVLLQILSGDTNTIIEISSSWFEAIAAFFCYIDPTRLKLEEYYEIAVDHLPVDSTVAWEEGCSAVLTGQYFLAIEKIESLDPFAATVICESCEAKGIMDGYTDSSFTSVRNWLLINFAKLCLADTEVYAVGIELLQLIQTAEAREIFAEYIPRVDFESPEDVNIAIHAALAFELPEIARMLNKITAKKMEAQGSYVEALIHLDTSKDTKALVQVAWKLFEEVLISGDLTDNEILMDAVNNTLDFEISPAVRNALAPYAVLAKAIVFVNENASSQAAQHIAALFKFPYMPLKYLGLLFLLATTLLDRSKPRVFSTSQIVLMMKALDKWEDSANEKEQQVGIELVKKCVLGRDEVAWEGMKKEIDSGLMFSVFRVKLAKEVSRAFLEGS